MEVILKKEYNDRKQSSSMVLSGNKWYEIQAFRAINQALGRCIRHKKDWGAIILLEQRFLQQRFINYLSKWIRNSINKSFTNFQSTIDSLNDFCSSKLNIQSQDLSLTDISIIQEACINPKPSIDKKIDTFLENSLKASNLNFFINNAIQNDELRGNDNSKTELNDIKTGYSNNIVKSSPYNKNNMKRTFSEFSNSFNEIMMNSHLNETFNNYNGFDHMAPVQIKCPACETEFGTFYLCDSLITIDKKLYYIEHNFREFKPLKIFNKNMKFIEFDDILINNLESNKSSKESTCVYWCKIDKLFYNLYKCCGCYDNVIGAKVVGIEYNRDLYDVKTLPKNLTEVIWMSPNSVWNTRKKKF